MISSGWSPNNILVKSSRANPFSKDIPPEFLVLFWNCSGLGPEVIMIEELFFLIFQQSTCSTEVFWISLPGPNESTSAAISIVLDQCRCVFFGIGKYAFRPQLAWLWKLTFGFFQVSGFWGKHRGHVRKRLGWTRRIHIVEYPPVNIQKWKSGKPNIYRLFSQRSSWWVYHLFILFVCLS